MKQLVLTLTLLLFTISATAIPAKRGLWQTLRLNDGTEIQALLCGDEHMHYWMDSDGVTYVADGDNYVTLSADTIKARAAKRRQQADLHRQKRLRKATIGEFNNFTGEKRGLIILVEFSDMKFQTGHDRELYDRIANEPGFTSSEGFNGSAADYFRDQSGGLFELTFDVVGPIQMSNGYAYYGRDSGGEGNDIRPGTMVATACQAVDNEVNFKDYDWDGDGEVDQVMIIYAGLGQADGGASNTIWPHEWQLTSSDYGRKLRLDNVYINTYACANERYSYYGQSGIEGIGTLCHEFSHCLGLPDMYDTNYGGNFGMGSWSLMDNGSYNNNGFTPPNYSSFEKMSCGWINPIELKRDTVVTDMKPHATGGEAYLVRNEAYENEYFLLENRQQTGWDRYIPGSGLMILYVDFDPSVWEYNIVNTTSSSSYYYGYPSNDHQRCTLIHANNRTSFTNYTGAVGDLYPYNRNDSLTDNSKPAATLYHANIDGRKYMNKPITQITRNNNGTISFAFKNNFAPAPPEDPTPDPGEEEGDSVLFYESFNQCKGYGGNDGRFGESVMPTATFIPDNDGWEAEDNRAYGADACARFGSGRVPGIVTTPEVGIGGETTLTFKAAAWNGDATTLTLTTNNESIIVEPSTFELSDSRWTQCEVKLIGTGMIRLVLTPSQRLFLDEVRVVGTPYQGSGQDPDEDEGTVTAISTLREAHPHSIYRIDGTWAGTQIHALPHGIYIINGKKIIK